MAPTVITNSLPGTAQAYVFSGNPRIYVRSNQKDRNCKKRNRLCLFSQKHLISIFDEDTSQLGVFKYRPPTQHRQQLFTQAVTHCQLCNRKWTSRDVRNPTDSLGSALFASRFTSGRELTPAWISSALACRKLTTTFQKKQNNNRTYFKQKKERVEQKKWHMFKCPTLLQWSHQSCSK